MYAKPLEHDYLQRTIRDGHHRALLAQLFDRFGIRAGDHVLEIGAGAGRFTSLLLEHGLRVTALEPDRILAEQLQERLAGYPGLSIEVRGVEIPGPLPSDIKLLCGFHVLHHLDEEQLASLRSLVESIRDDKSNFAGWFFLEPNPWNPLYTLQIALHPAMTFAEEQGIWRNDYDRSLSTRDEPVLLGTIGLFPPRMSVDRLPRRVQRWATQLASRRSLLRAYAVYGENDLRRCS